MSRVVDASRFPGLPMWDRAPDSHLRIRYNLAESTTAALSFGQLLAMLGEERIAGLKLGYPPTAGLPELRCAIGQRCGVAAETVLTTQGAAFALFLLAFELCRPGDDVVVVTPCFAPAQLTLQSCGVNMRTIGLRFDDSYRFDPERVASAITPETRLVSIASPHNPSGVHVSAQSVRRLLDAMADTSPRCLLLVDETFREASYGDDRVAASVAGLDTRIITTASISKAYGVPGLRVGWLTVPDRALRTRLIAAKANILIAGSMLDETLAVGLLSHPGAALVERNRSLAAARDVLSDWQGSVSKMLAWVPAEAGALSVFRLRREVFDDAAVARFWLAVETHGLRLAAGSWFGDEERIFRIGFGALPVGELREALAALAEVLAGVAGPP